MTICAVICLVGAVLGLYIPGGWIVTILYGAIGIDAAHFAITFKKLTGRWP